MDFDSDSKNRTKTLFGDEYKDIINNNGFISNQNVNPVVPMDDKMAVNPIRNGFKSLGSSNIPSTSAQSIWKVRTDFQLLKKWIWRRG